MPQLSFHGSSVLVPTPLALFEVSEEVNLHPIKLGEPAFGERPEGLDPINVGATISDKLSLVVANPNVGIIADVHQAIVATPAISHDDRLGAHLPKDHLAKCLCGTVRDNLSVDPATSLEDPEYRLFKGTPTSAAWHSLDSARAEVALIELDLTRYSPKRRLLRCEDQLTKDAVETVDRVAVETGQLSSLGCLNINAEMGNQLFKVITADSYHISSLDGSDDLV